MFTKAHCLLVFIMEQIATFNEQVEHADVNLFIRPLAFAEKGGIFIGFAHNIDLGLGLGFWIVTPPASERGKFNGRVARKKLFPEVLLADLLKDSAHILGQMRLDALICQVVCAARDDRIIFGYESVPEAEHIVLNGVDRLAGCLFSVGRFLLNDAERKQIFQIDGAYVGILTHLA